eukprot:CAMPEP_0175038852 /NCGR_PEP_ID=MMETSP0052_2-20121109/147_1 /TAXON_ID=51329 ORGANISM="Polytomella parva, Strain SAG 63-3" /NCGR_SAMPLE_ID=MMETSP0052_2 /ASSEMBLY_ACC=CAM_ASM_000194 /LENGTH=211 /DNA_ID=CAMNT_0016300417 /DNA_START=169 /DNA_END=800 /DNA_ORIENTATION=+
MANSDSGEESIDSFVSEDSAPSPPSKPSSGNLNANIGDDNDDYDDEVYNDDVDEEVESIDENEIPFEKNKNISTSKGGSNRPESAHGTSPSAPPSLSILPSNTPPKVPSPKSPLSRPTSGAAPNYSSGSSVHGGRPQSALPSNARSGAAASSADSPIRKASSPPPILSQSRDSSRDESRDLLPSAPAPGGGDVGDSSTTVATLTSRQSLLS